MSKRAQFASTVLTLMEADEKIAVLLGDIGVFSFREHMRRWPDRVMNAGVCEQGMIGLAAGLAMSGFYPVVSTIESFLLRRAYEFIRLDFVEQKLPGLFVGVGGENEYWRLGNTHRCPEGAALVRECLDIPFLDPDDDAEVERDIRSAIHHRSLVYIRLEESNVQVAA